MADIRDVESRHELLQIAIGYERIAQHAQARAAAKRIDTGGCRARLGTAACHPCAIPRNRW